VEDLVVEELVAEAPVAVQEISSPAAVEPASEIRWRHNAANPVDVDGDGRVFPRDALLVVNALLAYFGGPNRLPAPDHETAASVDVSGNGTLEPRDALLVLNALIELAKQNQVSGGSSFQADSRSVGPSGEAARTVDGTERLLDASAVKASPWQQAPPIELAAERVDPVFGSYGSEVSASTEWLVRHDVSANRLH